MTVYYLYYRLWVLSTLLLAVPVFAQVQAWDPATVIQRSVNEASDGRFRLQFEERTRWEERFGQNFGRDLNQQDVLSRVRVGAQWDATDWLRVSGMGQDGRTAFFGGKAPNTLYDSWDLQEAYVEMRARQKGFGAQFGRAMLNYGETRLIGVPQWSALARTYDEGRVYYRWPKVRLELLLISPVKIRQDEFNAPNLGDRVWGMYNTFEKTWHSASFDLYALRHSQNKIGGWTGGGTLGTNSFGGRWYGPLPHQFRYSFEAIGQTGHMGARGHRAYAWFAGVTRRLTLWQRPLDLNTEYKEASGTAAGASRSGTFDQLYPANHDKFGHEDLFGWRNIRNVRELATWNVHKRLALNLLYANSWLMSASDSLYNGQGRAISTSVNGTAGRHIGQELDSFFTWKAGALQIGAGFGHFFKGEFVQNTTPGINPRYFYVFQQYSF